MRIFKKVTFEVKSHARDSEARSPDQGHLALDDDNSPYMPYNWAPTKKIFHTICPSLFAFIITFGTSVSEPALPGIMEYFNVGRTIAISNITLYTVGLACGPLLLAPLSEMYGRRWIYIVASSCLLAFTAGAAVARNLATFLTCRFLGGFLGSVGIAIGAGTVVDLWPAGKQRAAASLLFVLGPFLAPSIAPIVGAYVLTAHDGDWRWTQWVTLFIGIPIWLLVMLMQETSQPMPIHQDGNVVVTRARIDNRLRALCLPFKMLCNDWIVLSLTLHTAFGYAVIFSYLTSIFYVLNLAYQFDTEKASLSLLSLVIGYFCAIVMCVYFDKKFCSSKGTASVNHAPPEKRLYAGMVGSILMLLGELWYALAARQGGHWAVVVAAGIPLGWGVFALFLSAVTYITHIYPAERVSSAIAANGALRYTLGAVFPLFTVQMYEKMGINWASAVFAFASLLLLPIPWMLCVYGKQLRREFLG